MHGRDRKALPRNLVAKHMHQRGGAHGPSGKAKRQADKRALRRALRENR